MTATADKSRDKLTALDRLVMVLLILWWIAYRPPRWLVHVLGWVVAVWVIFALIADLILAF